VGGFTSQPSPGTGSFGVPPGAGGGSGFGGTGPSPVIPPAPTPANGNGGNGADNGVRVPAPPENGHEQRLPIFDSLESDWFRRSGTTHATAQTAVTGTGAGTGAGTGTGEEPAWHSPADAGWRAAETVAAPSTGETTTAGLPRRVPRANLVPGSVGEPGAAPEGDSGGAPSRSAEEVRNRLASFQRGVREARATAPKTEEP
jgi:hypothetical protein